MMSDPSALASGWLTRRLVNHTLHSLATAALAIALALVSLVSLALGSSTLLGAAVTLVCTVTATLVAVLAVFRGRKLRFTAGAVLIAVYVAANAVHTSIGIDRHDIVVGLQELPIFALYLSGFYRPWTARIAAAIMLGTVSLTMLFGGLGATWTPTSVGPANLLGTIVFTWICCEAGVVLQAWFDEKTTVDSLTGALNRPGFMEAARTELRRASRTGTPTSIALIDIDAFKCVNDTQGHAAGDALLKALVTQWTTRTRELDLIGRLGGDEFIMLFPDTTAPDAEALLQRLRDEAPHPWSWGVTQVEGDEELTDVVHRADTAMYRSRDTN